MEAVKAKLYRYRDSVHSFCVVAQNRDYAGEVAASFKTQHDGMYDRFALNEIKSIPPNVTVLIWGETV